MDAERRIQNLKDRLTYIRDIFGSKEDDSIRLLAARLGEVLEREERTPGSMNAEELSRLEDLFDFSERKLDGCLSPMDKVRIVRHPQRICLKDILENVYDNYTELAGAASSTSTPPCSSPAPISPVGSASGSSSRWSWSSARKRGTARPSATAVRSSRGATPRRCTT